MRLRFPHDSRRYPHRRAHRCCGRVRGPQYLIVDALACYRLTRLITTDRVTAPAREAVDGWANRRRDWENPGPEPALAYLITCPWCVSCYVAAAVVMARRVVPRVWAPVARVLALSTVAGIVASTVADRD